MSRYDYRDPGTDPAYCDGLQAEDPIDDAQVDPAEHAYHAAVDAFATLEVELAKCSTTQRAWVLRRLTQKLDLEADRVMQAAASKLDDLVS